MKRDMKEIGRKGFTLAELLIVVAIIGILVAVSIPIFSGQLDKAKAATDKANVRAAKSAAIAAYLTDTPEADPAVYYYDAAAGTVTVDENAGKAIAGYGKSSKDIDDNADGIPLDNGTAHIVSISISGNGSKVSASWVYGTAAGGGSGSGGSASSGTVSITDTNGASHEIAASTTWEALTKELNARDSNNPDTTVTIPTGTVFSDGNGSQYLFYSWTGTANAQKNTTAAEFYEANKNSNSIMKLDSNTVILTAEKDTHQTQWNGPQWNTAPAAGTICYYNNSLYVTPAGSAAGNFPPGGQWVKLIIK